MVGNLRLIIDGARSAAYNMAADEALFNSLSKNLSPPTLRFYSWERPSLSIGFLQNAKKDVDFKTLEDKNYDFVRRPTGGRAVLHKDEVTFCVTMPTLHLGLWDIFRLVHQAIGEGFKMAGIPATVLPVNKDKIFSDTPEEKRKTAACFASPSRFELMINDKKVAGTAQKQKGEFILIHGSIPIVSSYKELYQVLNFPDEEKREASYKKGLEKMTSIYDETGKMFTREELYDYIIKGFESLWRVNVTKGDYTEDEKREISQLEETKYKNPEWLYKK